jgi:hypothetical protein
MERPQPVDMNTALMRKRLCTEQSIGAAIATDDTVRIFLLLGVEKENLPRAYLDMTIPEALKLLSMLNGIIQRALQYGLNSPEEVQNDNGTTADDEP